jgi:hypothetical protein
MLRARRIEKAASSGIIELAMVALMLLGQPGWDALPQH